MANQQTYTIKITPQDVLALRNGHPMETILDVGHTLLWPRPDHVYAAFIYAFKCFNFTNTSWVRKHHLGKINAKTGKCQDNGKYAGDGVSKEQVIRFGGLQTWGPFPCNDKTMYLPTPADVYIEKSDEKMVTLKFMKIKSLGESTNLPKPLSHGFLSGEQSKERPPEFLSVGDYEKLLKEGSISISKDYPKFTEVERVIGTAIDPETNAAQKRKNSGDTNQYQIEYLRFGKDVSMICGVKCIERGHDEPFDVAGTVLTQESQLIMGGQQGVVNIEKVPCTLPSISAGTQSRYVRWTLISPAVFAPLEKNGIKVHDGGWIPSWIDGDGKVLLEKKNPNKPKEGVKAKLIAACVPKPIPIVQWNPTEKCPEKTILAVPAGAVYVFDCETSANAEKLIELLNCVDESGEVKKRHSAMFGSAGFGLGYATFVNEQNVTPNN